MSDGMDAASREANARRAANAAAQREERGARIAAHKAAGAETASLSPAAAARVQAGFERAASELFAVALVLQNAGYERSAARLEALETGESLYRKARELLVELYL